MNAIHCILAKRNMILKVLLKNYVSMYIFYYISLFNLMINAIPPRRLGHNKFSMIISSTQIEREKKYIYDSILNIQYSNFRYLDIYYSSLQLLRYGKKGKKIK